MTVRLRGQVPGPIRKYAWVYGEGEGAEAELCMAITIRQSVALSPPVLDFGTVPLGEDRSLTMTVTADADRLAPGGFPQPISTNPDLDVAPSGPITPTTRDGKRSETRTYTVTLTGRAAAGTVEGKIVAVPAMAQSSLPPAALQPMSGAFTTIEGEVTGKLSATPKSLFFGSVPSGRDVTRQIVLTATEAEVAGLAVSSGSANVSAFVQPQKSLPNGMRLLSVTLSGKTPPGPFSTLITLQGPDGERLAIPVVAEITSSP